MQSFSKVVVERLYKHLLYFELGSSNFYCLPTIQTVLPPHQNASLPSQQFILTLYEEEYVK